MIGGVTGVPRIQVVGNSGAGKTHLARRIAEQLDVPHLELDALHHLPGWRQRPAEEFRTLVRRFLDEHDAAGWIVDGNYRGRLNDFVLGRADTIVWLDYPRRVTTARVARRTLHRVVTRQQLWNGNRERWRALVDRDPSENILLWSWTQHARYRQEYDELYRTRADVTWIRLTTPRQTEQWLATLP